MKILVLEDNERLCSVIKSALSKENYKVDIYNDGQEALEALANGYSCFLLDINVPSIDGISILESIRMIHKDIPVIIMSSNYDLDNIQTSYEVGCNDYLKKPFFMYELIQKIKKLCTLDSCIVDLSDGYIFDTKKHSLCLNGTEIKLTKKEILFLELLSSKIGKVFTFEEIEEYVWEGEEAALVNIRALVKRLRKKIPEEAIEAVKGLGYTFNTYKISSK